MSGMSWRGTWYVPAGGTFMGKLFKDAGAAYRYANNPATSSIPLNIEQVIQEFADADVWVGADVRTFAELKAMDAKHTWFQAYQTGQVYHYLKRSLPSGANDFWARKPSRFKVLVILGARGVFSVGSWKERRIFSLSSC